MASGTQAQGRTMAQDFPRLLGDVGGTNAPWAWQPLPNAALERVHVLPCSKFGAIDACIEDSLRLEGLPAPHWAAFGIATAVTGDPTRGRFRLQRFGGAWRRAPACAERFGGPGFAGAGCRRLARGRGRSPPGPMSAGSDKTSLAWLMAAHGCGSYR